MFSISEQLVKDRRERLLRVPKRHREPAAEAAAGVARAEAVPANTLVDRAPRAYLDVA